MKDINYLKYFKDKQQSEGGWRHPTLENTFITLVLCLLFETLMYQENDYLMGGGVWAVLCLPHTHTHPFSAFS